MSDDEDRGFRSIGNLTPEIVRSPQSLALMLEKSRPSSATIGRRFPVAKQLGSIGTQHSEMRVVSTPRDIRGLMASENPENTDKQILASLPQSVARSLTPATRTWDDPVSGFDYEITGYSLADPLPQEAELEIARELVAAAMQPAPAKSVAVELARLAAVTKSRVDPEDDQALRFAAFREELVEFPEDVIRSALRKIARRETFFPSLAEIRDQCQREFRHRKRLASALERRT